ncbi:hypothetical protein FOMPIDRAFT_58317 [Fomitopsis schrenkii]|uniref:Uncharacterized protein n=1 Tax=Fomitopsis schrenkii TaxID=2126942 RepID=S8F6Q0_FOMSC|nr:hypothetical protein FOMPIDRAFT_58317 [Fomitopsis schrenkii]
MPSLFPLDNFLGVLFVGIIVSTVLYGVNCLQAYTYYTRFCAADNRWLQLLVIYLYGVFLACRALDTLHVALICAAYYHYTVTNYGDYIALNRVTW